MVKCEARLLLQIVDQKNKAGPIPDNVNWLSADMKGIYQNMPESESEAGCREYLDKRKLAPGDPTTENVIEC